MGYTVDIDTGGTFTDEFITRGEGSEASSTHHPP